MFLWTHEGAGLFKAFSYVFVAGAKILDKISGRSILIDEKSLFRYGTVLFRFKHRAKRQNALADRREAFLALAFRIKAFLEILQVQMNDPNRISLLLK